MNPGLALYQRRMAAVVLSAVIGLFGVLLGRLVYINTALSEKLTARAERQYAGNAVIPARRGSILDANHRVVAASRQMPDVFVDAARVEDIPSLASELAVRLNVSPAELANKLASRPDSRYVVVAQGVDEVTAEAITSMKHPAVGLTDRQFRTYPLGSSMAHVLGIVGKDGRGLEGIELAFNEQLSGKNGRSSTIRDARRRPLFRVDDEPSLDPQDGASVVLTIDAEVQRITERAVERAVTEFGAESGIGIVLSPQTGDVLAMACYPAFNPQEGNTTPPALRRNRVLTDPIEPGSTFKPFVASGALARGIIRPNEQIDCKMGSHFFGSRHVKDEHAYGMLDIRGIISHSSNIGMTMICERMGPQRLRDSMRAFGFGERTGIELPGEASGVVYPLRMWTRASIPSVAMGYEVQVTPLQLAMAFAALVNDGQRIKPRIVKELISPNGDVIKSFDEPRTIGPAVTADVAHFMAQDLMASVVEEGTGKRAKLENYGVVGKTGTAKLIRRDGKRGYEPGQYLSLFMGASPVQEPEVLALVIVRRPIASQGYFGGIVSAPAVREILQGTLPYLDVTPDVVNMLADAALKEKRKKD